MPVSGQSQAVCVTVGREELSDLKTRRSSPRSSLSNQVRVMQRRSARFKAWRQLSLQSMAAFGSLGSHVRRESGKTTTSLSSPAMTMVNHGQNPASSLIRLAVSVSSIPASGSILMACSGFSGRNRMDRGMDVPVCGASIQKIRKPRSLHGPHPSGFAMA